MLCVINAFFLSAKTPLYWERSRAEGFLFLRNVCTGTPMGKENALSASAWTVLFSVQGVDHLCAGIWWLVTLREIRGDTLWASLRVRK